MIPFDSLDVSPKFKNTEENITALKAWAETTVVNLTLLSEQVDKLQKELDEIKEREGE